MAGAVFMLKNILENQLKFLNLQKKLLHKIYATAI